MRQHIIRTICILLAVTICVIAVITLSGQKKVNWEMTAYVVAEDSSIMDTFSMTINGKIKDRKENKDMSVHFLRIRLTPDKLPDSFAYSENGNPAYRGTMCEGADPKDHHVHDCTYNKDINGGRTCHYFLNVEKGYFMAYWPDSPEYYLVAATDSNATPQEITDHFDAYYQYFIEPNWPGNKAE